MQPSCIFGLILQSQLLVAVALEAVISSSEFLALPDPD